ncbi:MAG: hypothetical protein RIQ79_2389 [Verrucomicrobiota bacterium]
MQKAAFMTTTTPVNRPARRRNYSGFSLVEVIIATTLSAIVMTAVLSAFLFIGRSTINLRNYADMETESRSAIETFAQDTRMASAINWVSANSLIITTKLNGAVVAYTYTYTPTVKIGSKTTVGTLTRQQTSPSTGIADVLMNNVKVLTFTAYNINTFQIYLNGEDGSALPTSGSTDSVDNATKQIQLSVETERTTSTDSSSTNKSLGISTNKVMSARFILRNKIVTS